MAGYLKRPIVQAENGFQKADEFALFSIVVYFFNNQYIETMEVVRTRPEYEGIETLSRQR